MTQKKLITIKTNTAEVFVGDNVFNVLNEYLRAYQNQKIFILVDENSSAHCASELIDCVDFLVDAQLIEITSGEENKTLTTCYQLWKTLADYNAERNSLLINLGGGVITDMGGFIASTYKRGIDFINIPTTLLAQIDASVGGKVAVDFENLKNIIGVFNDPKGVFIYPPFLKTLDKRQMLSGYAEALKHGLIKDKNYWNQLKNGLLSDANDWQKLITSSITIKNEVVLSDPLEKDARKVLNFGHTIGHAIESYALIEDENPLCHGEAVAIGMICESFISHKIGNITIKELTEIVNCISSYYNHYPLKMAGYYQLLELMKKDKKNELDSINFTLLLGIGKAQINQDVEMELITESLDYYRSLAKVKTHS